jgi:cyanophycinase-like exopeptidase
MARLLVIMGSGETAPTMVKPHRAVFERVGAGPAILLDTPYGFQENADDISSRAVNYFSASVGRKVEVVSWRADPSPLERERALAAIHDAGWIFAGPGSPSYALRLWRDTPVPEALADKLGRDGVVLFASAAALTLGSHTIPVYEIYKAGFEPHWLPGFDLLHRVLGLPAVVIPHYNNTEGGHHDTRFCYLGERRLSRLEQELPEESFILGVDEHTAVVLDLDARTASVLGNGTMTIRGRGHSAVHPAGSVLGFDDLLSAARDTPAATPEASTVDGEPAPARATSLLAEAERIDAACAQAHERRDVDGCVTAILDLQQALVEWGADTDVEEREQSEATMRRMVLRLAELASVGARDPREVLELRSRARKAKDFPTSDWIRDRLTSAGIEIRDTPTGVEWDLR